MNYVEFFFIHIRSFFYIYNRRVFKEKEDYEDVKLCCVGGGGGGDGGDSGVVVVVVVMVVVVVFPSRHGNFFWQTAIKTDATYCIIYQMVWQKES